MGGVHFFLIMGRPHTAEIGVMTGANEGEELHSREGGAFIADGRRLNLNQIRGGGA